jgi:dienelactone hydrolase
MHWIIVSDIFGRTSALEKIAEALSGDVDIFDPYDSEHMAFNSEAQAYAYFSSEVGLEAYTDMLSRKLASQTNQVSLIGFSVGASAIWRISEKEELKNISNAICFYGSQIRNYIDITPKFPIQLIFPSSESHFLVSELIHSLEGKEGIEIHRADFPHGFMNSHSENFYQRGYDQFMKSLCKVSI